MTAACTVKILVPVNPDADPDTATDAEFFGSTHELTGRDAERVLEAAGLVRMPQSLAATVCLSDVKSGPITWLWRGRIARGKLSLLVGDPGLGKSFVTLDMAARISTGSPWPDHTPAPTGSVILLTAEDDPADTIRPRLDALGANPTRVHVMQAVREPDKDGNLVERPPRLDDLAALAEVIDRIGDVRLIIVDPIAAYIGADVDSHKNSDIRTLLAPLASLAARYGVAIVGVSHLNKSQGGAIYRTMGSLAFTAAARAVWCVTKDPKDELRRLVLPIKNNIGPDQGGLAYRIEDDRGRARIVWENQPVNANVNDMLAQAAGASEDRTERDEAADWLRNLLAEGPLSAKDVQRNAREAGFSWRTVERAKAILGIKPAKTRFSGGWEWALPNPANTASHDHSPKNVAVIDDSGRLREFPEENMGREGAQSAEQDEDRQDRQSGQSDRSLSSCDQAAWNR